MKVTGLITEYNPFHNGHLYHMNRSREITGADYCIVLMSGSFVQRGAPAIYDKYIRTSMALQAGADLVLEMPAAFSTASAKEFAAFGISLFTRLKVVDSVCFGSESGDITQLQHAASLLIKESKTFSETLKKGLKNGLTFPEARNHALLSEYDTLRNPQKSTDLWEPSFLTSPNNILGIEYCRAAKELHSPLHLHTITRQGNGYHDSSTDTILGSALAIRQSIEKKQDYGDLRSLVPPHVFRLIGKETPMFPNDFSSLLNYKILMETSDGALTRYADISTELAARIQKNALIPDSFEDRIQSLKTRQITYTRVSRALLHLMLGITKEEVSHFKEQGYGLYARVLGFRSQSAPLLKAIKNNSEIPLLTKTASASKRLSPPACAMLEQEIKASHIYQMIKQEKGCAFKNEYTQPVLIL